MKRVVLMLFLSFGLLIMYTGCLVLHHDVSEIDESLAGLTNYIIDNSDHSLIISAYDERNNERQDICLRIVVNERNSVEQYEIINSVICSVNEYISGNTDINGSSQLIDICFLLPVDRYSGVPGEYLCEITNLGDNELYADSLIRIYPMSYGYHYDDEKHAGEYEIPDRDFYGIHIMSLEYASNERIEEYIASWESIDTIYVSTNEQATGLRARYPYITFIGYNN